MYYSLSYASITRLVIRVRVLGPTLVEAKAHHISEDGRHTVVSSSSKYWSNSLTDVMKMTAFASSKT